MLDILNELPTGLIEHDSTEIHRFLDGPTLIHLPGAAEPPLFVSVLQHGNEFTGWDVVRELLADWGSHRLPRAMSLFVGNVAGASAGMRRLDGQPDYNRIWGRPGDGAEHHMARDVLAEMSQRRVFAAVDIHNTSGQNPPYSCVSSPDPLILGIAARFSPRVILFSHAQGVQSRAFEALAPSLTIECGLPGSLPGREAARKLLDELLIIEELAPTSPTGLDVYQSIVRVDVAPSLTVGQYGDNADVTITADLDALNFETLPAGTTFAIRRSGLDRALVAFDSSGAEVADLYFASDGSRIVNRVPIMPVMLSPDTRIVRQDCLCYLMEAVA